MKEDLGEIKIEKPQQANPNPNPAPPIRTPKKSQPVSKPKLRGER